jgi:hypothetical protein
MGREGGRPTPQQEAHRATLKNRWLAVGLIAFAAAYTVMPDPIPIVDDLALDYLALRVGFALLANDASQVPGIVKSFFVNREYRNPPGRPKE